MQTTARRKITISFDCLVANGLILTALLLMLAGCVVEPEPHSYYRSYPNDYTYYGYEQPGSSTVIVHDNDDRDHDQREHGDYDNHWDYGRRGNGNFHGSDADDRHDD